MKNYLLICSGLTAKTFIKRIQNVDHKEAFYDVICERKEELEDLSNGSEAQMQFHYFDPTSAMKFVKVFDPKQHNQIFITMVKPDEARMVYKNIRSIDKKIQITMLDYWDIDLDIDSDDNLDMINSKDILSNRMLSKISQLPLYGQFVGLGKGELLEVTLPFASIYAYRHLENIRMKGWSVAGVYRKDQILVPEPHLLLRPNDSLLLFGEPNILKEVHKAISINQGIFPEPYGKNALHLIDMDGISFEQAQSQIEQSLFLHQNMKNQELFIEIFNPSDSRIFKLVRSIDVDKCHINICYEKLNIQSFMLDFVYQNDIGLIILKNYLFSKKQYKKIFLRLEKCVLSLGERPLITNKESLLLLTNNAELENISSSVFDVANQLKFKIKLYDIDPNQADKSDIIEHFEDLANIYNQKIQLQTLDKNPFRVLMKRYNFLQFALLDKNILNTSVLHILFPNLDLVPNLLDDYNQLFIPPL